jgi:hypothetical protein
MSCWVCQPSQEVHRELNRGEITHPHRWKVDSYKYIKSYLPLGALSPMMRGQCTSTPGAPLGTGRSDSSEGTAGCDDTDDPAGHGAVANDINIDIQYSMYDKVAADGRDRDPDLAVSPASIVRCVAGGFSTNSSSPMVMTVLCVAYMPAKSPELLYSYRAPR